MSIFPAPSEAAVPATAPPTVVTRRSAGRAWLFSLLLPGAGQIYCDAWMRGWATLTVFFFAAIVAAAAAGDASYVALRLAIFLHVFGHLDAYFTARETHRGIEPGADDNPRVAAMLNLVTGLWGYVYLGAINLVKFILLLFALRGLTKLLPLAVEVAALITAVHAWRLAAAKRLAVDPLAGRAPNESAIHPAVPVALAVAVVAIYYDLALLGQLAIWFGWDR